VLFRRRARRPTSPLLHGTGRNLLLWVSLGIFALALAVFVGLRVSFDHQVGDLSGRVDEIARRGSSRAQVHRRLHLRRPDLGPPRLGVSRGHAFVLGGVGVTGPGGTWPGRIRFASPAGGPARVLGAGKNGIGSGGRHPGRTNRPRSRPCSRNSVSPAQSQVLALGTQGRRRPGRASLVRHHRTVRGGQDHGAAKLGLAVSARQGRTGAGRGRKHATATGG